MMGLPSHSIWPVHDRARTIDMNSALRREVIDSAKRWPTTLRARLAEGMWTLLGAGKNVRLEFESCAALLVRELGLLLVSSDPTEALLHHLKESGRHVRRKELLARSGRTVARGTEIVISPLRDALIEYLRHGSGTATFKLNPTKQPPSTGQAAAAGSNRQHETRLRIVQALVRLRIPRARWPGFVRASYNVKTRFTQDARPAPFQPPEFDRLNQSRADWTKVADAAWETHRNQFLAECDFWVKTGVDDEIPEAKRRRGAGKKTSRPNTSIDLRFEWAAQRLCGLDWKEIADLSENVSTVAKAAKEVLEAAGWRSHARNTNP